MVTSKTVQLHIIPANHLAEASGSAQAVNMVMMGAFLGGNSVLQNDSVTSSIEEINPKFASSNLEAFWKGYWFVKKEKAA
jgi:Pyruvate/2-oxoacid:ferredoxin oxidoreductase gamma subunit